MDSTSYKMINHMFGSGETIQAIIRKYNHMAMTPLMLNMLTEEFNNINGKIVPKPGDTMQIPIFIGFLGMIDKK